MELPSQIEKAIAAQLPAYERRHQAWQEAGNTAVPGPVAEAVDQGPVVLGSRQIAVDVITVGAYRFRPVVLGDFTLMQKLENGAGDVMDQLELGACLIYLFTHPVASGRALMREGVGVFREAAMDFMQDVPLAYVPTLTQAMRENIERSAAAKVELGVPGKEENPRMPVPVPTASGAGSICSAVS